MHIITTTLSNQTTCDGGSKLTSKRRRRPLKTHRGSCLSLQFCRYPLLGIQYIVRTEHVCDTTSLPAKSLECLLSFSMIFYFIVLLDRADRTDKQILTWAAGSRQTDKHGANTDTLPPSYQSWISIVTPG